MVDEGCMVLGNTQYWVAGPGPDQVQGLVRWFAVAVEGLPILVGLVTEQ